MGHDGSLPPAPRKTCESSVWVSELAYANRKRNDKQKVVVQTSRAISLKNDTIHLLLLVCRQLPFVMIKVIISSSFERSSAVYQAKVLLELFEFSRMVKSVNIKAQISGCKASLRDKMATCRLRQEKLRKFSENNMDFQTGRHKSKKE